MLQSQGNDAFRSRIQRCEVIGSEGSLSLGADEAAGNRGSRHARAYHDTLPHQIWSIEAFAHLRMIDMVDIHVGNDRSSIRFAIPKSLQSRIMPPKFAGCVELGLFAGHAVSPRAPSRNVQALITRKMVQREIIGTANRKQLFAKGNVKSRLNKIFDRCGDA